MLHATARKLSSSDDAERDAAMGKLLQAGGRAVGPLIDVLTEPGAATGRIALLLSALGARRSIDTLVRLVEAGMLRSDERPFVTRALAELLSEEDAEDPRRLAAVMRLTSEPDPATRRFAAQALGAIGSQDAQAQLRQMAATDRDASVKKAALETLVALKESGRLASTQKKPPAAAPARPTAAPPTPAPPTPAPSSPSTTASASNAAPASSSRAGEASPDGSGGGMEDGGLAIDLEALVAAHAAVEAPTGDEPSVDFEVLVAQANEAGGHLQPHLDQLGALRWADRNAAVEELVKAGRASVPHLIERLGHPHAGVRTGACMALMRLQAPEAASGLLMVATAEPTTDDERELRAIALKALANSLTGAEEGLAEPLIPLARDPDRWVRAGALLCLGRIADRLGTRVAVLALEDDDPIVRDAAAVAVSEGAREEDEDLVLPLLAILGGFPSPSAEVQEAILIALSRIHVDADPVKVRLRRRVRKSILGQTTSMRRTALGILEKCWSNDDPPPVSVIDDILSRLDDDHPEVRVLAASFAARHLEPGMTGALARLEAAILAHEPSVGLLSLEALHRHDTPEAKSVLERLSSHADAGLSQRARELLEGFVPRATLWAYEAAPEPEPEEEDDEDYAYEEDDDDGEENYTYEDQDDEEGHAAEEQAAPPPPVVAPVAVPTTPAPTPAPPVIVEARIPEAQPFADDPGLRLRDRLSAVRDAGGSGRLAADDAKAARGAVLLSFATAPRPTAAAPVLPAGRLIDQLHALRNSPAPDPDALRHAVLAGFAEASAAAGGESGTAAGEGTGGSAPSDDPLAERLRALDARRQSGTIDDAAFREQRMQLLIGF